MIIGTVPYLNVQPMVWAIEQGLLGGGITLLPEVPRKLAELLAQKRCDTAIVSVFEYFRHPNLYSYIRGPVIASCGAVRSVMMYSSEPWGKLHRVYLDASSLTSVNLFKVLSAENGYTFEYLDTVQHVVPRPLPPGTGWVVIGDPAIHESEKHPYSLDLGLAWREMTNLPFVFAAWLVPLCVKQPGMAALLSESLKLGLSQLEKVAEDGAARFGVTQEFALRYFTDNIQYHFGDEELTGWKKFGELCYRHGLVSSIPEFRQYQEH